MEKRSPRLPEKIKHPRYLHNLRCLQHLSLLLGLGVLLTALNPRGFAQHATFFTESASGDIWLLRDDFLPWNPFQPERFNAALRDNR